MTDYYEVLGLRREAEDDEVAKAYRRYAMAYNPLCQPDDPNPQALMKKFKLASQAYSVLSNPKIRAVYDLYGEEGVRHGGTGSQGIPGGLDLDAIDPNSVFKSFFGVDNPFQVVGSVDSAQNNQQNFFSEDAVRPKTLPKCAPVLVTLPVTLEDVFYGAMRRAMWQCTHVGMNNATTATTESFELRVEKGAKTGDHFTVDGRGNTAPGCARGDVVVRLELQPHPRFRREGDNLVVAVPITLTEALSGTTVVVTTMEGRELSVLIDEIVHPNYRSRVEGSGLPRGPSESAGRGDLVLEYVTKFPSFLTLEQKSEIRRILEATN